MTSNVVLEFFYEILDLKLYMWVKYFTYVKYLSFWLVKKHETKQFMELLHPHNNPPINFMLNKETSTAEKDLISKN